MFRPADEGRASFKFTLPENFLVHERIAKEIQHGRFLAEHGAGEIWNWESPAGKLRWARRVKMLSKHLGPRMPCTIVARTNPVRMIGSSSAWRRIWQVS